MRRALGIVLALLLLPRLAAAQSLPFHAPASVDDPTTPAVMRDLASRIIPGYFSDNREQYLANMSALQLVAGNFDEAYSVRLDLQQLRGGTPHRPPADPALVYDLYAHAMSLQAQYRLPFAQAFDLAFWETIPAFDNLDGYRVETWLEAPPATYAQALQASFDGLRGRERISQRLAFGLIWQYLAFEAYRSFGPIAPGLISLDEDRRYNIQDDVEVDTPGHGKVLALLVRPRSAASLLTTLLQYRIAPGGYDDAIEAAAYGFAGMVGFTPRVRAGRHAWQVIPFEGEGDRARAVIDWIAKQPWSDAQLGMYGNGYSGFVAWAVTKRLPPQLKAIATSDAMAPGINFPMDGGIGLNGAYRWLQRIETEREESDAAADASPACHLRPHPERLPRPRLQPAARTGAMRSMRNGMPLARRIATCRALPASRARSSGAGCSILPMTITGGGSRLRRRSLRAWIFPCCRRPATNSPARPEPCYYFVQHYAHDPHAAQMLLAGPYDEAEIRGGRAEEVLRDYRTDPAAVLDLRTIELQWFAYLFLNDPKPALLTDRVNFQVMGGNVWEHAGSVDDLAKDRVRLYLATEPHAGSGSLIPREPASHAAVHLTANLARRKDDNGLESPSLMTASVPVDNGFAFVSGPLPGGLEIAGHSPASCCSHQQARPGPHRLAV